MKTLPPLLFGLALLASKASAADQIVTLGDSLTFAYEAEFCFKQTTAFGVIGDGMPQSVRNWIELISNPTIVYGVSGDPLQTGPPVANPAYRGDFFDLGTRQSVLVTPPVGAPFPLYFRQSHNWAIPGLKADGMRQFVLGEKNFTDLVDFAAFNLLLDYSDFNDATHFGVADFNSQVQNTAERVVIAVGGNDIRGVYGDIYNDLGAGTFVSDFMVDITAVVERVQQLKPGIQIVLVNVPHVGITQKVRETYPYDAVKTERVSAVLRDLNGQMAALAATKGIGYADIYTPTLEMTKGLEDTALFGMPFKNRGNNQGAAGSCWLNGTLSDNFHPNTQGQSVIANEIIDAFNKRYQTGIRPIMVAEIGPITNRSNAQMNPAFTLWLSRYSLPSQPATNDPDGDGVSLGVEYLTNLDPTRNDSWKIAQRLTGGNLELSYPLRFNGTAPGGTVRGTISVESSTTLSAPFSSVTLPAMGADGLIRTTIPASGGKAFMRLKATIN